MEISGVGAQDYNICLQEPMNPAEFMGSCCLVLVRISGKWRSVSVLAARVRYVEGFRTVHVTFINIELRTGYLQRQLPAEQRLHGAHMSGNNLSAGFLIISLRGNWVLPDLLQEMNRGR